MPLPLIICQLIFVLWQLAKLWQFYEPQLPSPPWPGLNNIHLFIYRNFFVILGNRQGQALLATSFHITAWQGFQAYRSIVGNLLVFHVDSVVFVDCFPPHNCNEKKSMSLSQ